MKVKVISIEFVALELLFNGVENRVILNRNQRKNQDNADDGIVKIG